MFTKPAPLRLTFPFGRVSERSAVRCAVHSRVGRDRGVIKDQASQGAGEGEGGAPRGW